VSEPVMMKCGHASQGTMDGKPACIACYGINPGATEVERAEPDLAGREARCFCGNTQPSSVKLAFFRRYPDSPYDSFYCGCRGWD
jgi:hypothetical protein